MHSEAIYRPQESGGRSQSSNLGTISRKLQLNKAVALVRRILALPRSIANRKSLLNTQKKQERSSQPPQSEDRLKKVVARLWNHPEFEAAVSPEAPWGHFGGRHVIGENTPINRGVYMGVEPHEAIVVDDRYQMLKQCYWGLMVQHIREESEDDVLDEQRLVYRVLSFVENQICLQPEETVNRFIHNGKPRPDNKVALDLFIECGIGLARHQVLLAAYLLERLKIKGMITGDIFIDSNYNGEKNSQERLIYAIPKRPPLIFTPGE